MRENWNKRKASEEWHIHMSGSFSSPSSPLLLLLPPWPPPPPLRSFISSLHACMLVCLFLADNTISPSRNSNLKPIIQHEAWNIINKILWGWNNEMWITYLITNGCDAAGQAIPFDPEMHFNESCCHLHTSSFPSSARSNSVWGGRALSSCSASPQSSSSAALPGHLLPQFVTFQPFVFM